MSPRGPTRRILLGLLVAIPALPFPGMSGEETTAEKPGNKPEPPSIAEKQLSVTADWPQFRGDPRLHGFRSDSVPIADSPRLLWSYDAGVPIESSAAIVGKVTYIGTTGGELLALDLLTDDKDGSLLWKYKAGEAGVLASPGVRDGKVFFGDEYGLFHAVDAQSGKKMWSYETEGGAEIISSVNFFEDRVLFGSYDGHLYCLSSGSGKLLWKYLTGGPVHSTPAVIDGKTFVAGCDAMLRVIDVATGKQERELEMGEYSAASPAVRDDLLFVGTFAGEVQAIDWRKGKRSWTYTHPTKSLPFYSSAALGGGSLVVGGRDRLIHVLDPQSGKSQWTFTTKARVDSSPALVGRRAFCGSSDRNLYLLDLEERREVWRFAADGAFLASPSLGRGRLVIGADNGLVYCFGVRPASKDSARPPVSGDSNTNG